MGHFAKLCRSKLPEQPTPRPSQRPPQQTYNQSPGSNQTRRVRHVTEQSQEVNKAITEDNAESIDPEATLYLKELKEDWANIKLVQPKVFRPVKNIIVNKEQNDEIWVQTTCNNSEKIDWLADTGSPRNFINPTMANKFMTQKPNVRIENYNENKHYRCFNNKEIKIKVVIHMDTTSGSWCAKRYPILTVEQNTTNLMGRDVLLKLGISLQQTKQQVRQIHHISDVETGKNIIKWIFKKYLYLCTRLARSKNHIAKSLFRENHYSNQQKGRRVPLHLLEKVEQEIDRLINDKQIVRLEKCPDDVFISPVVITVKKRTNQ